MNCSVRRRCAHCSQPFTPDYRNTKRQRYCSQTECRLASKKASQLRWLRKPENRNYFRDATNVCRVQQWRQGHPGYWRSTRPGCPPSALPQEPGTLQDYCRSKSPVLMGLVSRLATYALQEDIARCANQVVWEAQCILVHCQTNVSTNPRPALRRICNDTS